MAQKPETVWIVAPEVPGAACHGSAPLVERLVAHLPGAGAAPAVAAARLGPVALPGPGAPGIIHVIDPLRAGRAAGVFHEAAPGARLVATLASATLDADLSSPEPLRAIRAVVERADALTVQHAEAASLVARTFPEAPAPTVIPPGAYLPDDKHEWQVGFVRQKDIPAGEVVFLVLGAISSRADPVLPVQAVTRLRGEGLPVQLVFAGPILDHGLAVMLTASTSLYRFVHYLSCVPRGGVRALLERADVLVHAATGEGAPDAIAEAFTEGVPVVARDREGVRGLVRDGREGMLFRTPDELTSALRRLARDAEARAILGLAAREAAGRRLDPKLEAAAYLGVYRAAAGV